jgi:SAM-dependent methyltransferase
MELTQRVDAQTGYDLWSETYDETPNPVVAMDARHTIALLNPQADERILDAGCGTGRNLAVLLTAGAEVVGLDFSVGMLAQARRKHPSVELHQADLQARWPVADGAFDAVLCALIGEHLENLHAVYSEAWRVLRAGGRFVFSVYHPQLAVAGKEANFDRAGVNYRLGALLHSVEDYRQGLVAAGFSRVELHEFVCDEAIVAAVPQARKYLGQRILLVLRAEKPRSS